MIKTISTLFVALISLNSFAASPARPNVMLKKFHQLEEIASDNSSDEIKMTAQNSKKAQLYAEELLRMAPKFKKDWSYGNAIHHGHLVLGRVALFNNDVKKAEKHLALAGKTPGSPQLNSFGPNMTLAKELLEKGKKESVVSYIDDCVKFWSIENDEAFEQALAWKYAISVKMMPNFKANLVY